MKFSALVPHPATSPHSPPEFTKFLALDKVLPNRDFLQVEWRMEEEKGV